MNYLQLPRDIDQIKPGTYWFVCHEEHSSIMYVQPYASVQMRNEQLIISAANQFFLNGHFYPNTNSIRSIISNKYLSLSPAKYQCLFRILGHGH